MSDITYDEATTAQKLGNFIIRFGKVAGIIKEADPTLTTLQLADILDTALGIIEGLRGKPSKDRKRVDIFWERQGWYFYNGTATSKEYEDLDECIRAAHEQGYAVRDVRRTRGSVPQPKAPLPELKNAE